MLATAARMPGWLHALQPLPELLGAVYRTASTNSHLGTSMPAPQSLNDIMKVEHMSSKTHEEVADIWLQYHSDDLKGRAASVLPGPLWKAFQLRGGASPNFVLPIGKGQGKSLTILLQCQLPHVLFTSLEDFKQLGASAQPVMTLTHYTELLSSHDIVLARADVLKPTVISVPEARTLMALTHAFYNDPQSFLMVNQFNHEPDQFRYEELLRQLGHNPDGATDTTGSSP